MGIINKILSLLLIVILGVSCSNDFDIIEGKVDVPVVYAILSAQDTAHYVRLEKAFVDPDIPASELAQDPNQLYYDEATVMLLKEVANGNEVKYDTFTLRKVDGNKEGYVRDSGAFAQAPNYLYKIHNDEIQLEEEKEYVLLINVPGQEEIRATTTIVERNFFSSPNISSQLAIPANRNIKFSWKNGNFSVLTSGYMDIKYQEVANGEIEEKVIRWNLFENIEQSIFDFKSNEFYNFLGSNIDVDPDVTRYMIGVDYVLISGGIEIKDYLRVAQANLGITSSGDIPNYSNLSRGRGIFTSRGTSKAENLIFNGSTITDIVTNDLTKDLNFKF